MIFKYPYKYFLFLYMMLDDFLMSLSMLIRGA